VFEHLHFLIEAALFGQVAEAVFVLALEGLSKNGDLAGVGDDDADDHAQRAGLAGAVGTEQAVDSAGLNAERKVFDGDKVAVALADVGQLNRAPSTGVLGGTRRERGRLGRRHGQYNNLRRATATNGNATAHRSSMRAITGFCSLASDGRWRLPPQRSN
jgi:hypothetical protein